MKIGITLSLEPNLVARLDKLVRKSGTNRSWVVSQIISGWIDTKFGPSAAPEPEPEPVRGRKPRAAVAEASTPEPEGEPVRGRGANGPGRKRRAAPPEAAVA